MDIAHQHPESSRLNNLADRPEGKPVAATATAESNMRLLRELGLHGMAAALEKVDPSLTKPNVSWTVWLGQLLDQERDFREKRRFERRWKAARLDLGESLDDPVRAAAYGLDDVLFRALTGGEWVRERRNVLITGTAGVGKTWLAQALGRNALVDGCSVAYYRASHLFDKLKLARAEGRYEHVMRTIARLDLLILDDWGVKRLNVEQRNDLLDLIEDRYKCRSTVIVSQVPIERWHRIIGDSPISARIFFRLYHNSHRVELGGR